MKMSGMQTTATRIRLRICDTSESPLPVLVGGQRAVELVFTEIGPEHVGIVELGIGRLPQQEIGDTQLAAGADHQIRIGHATGRRDSRKTAPPERWLGSALPDAQSMAKALAARISSSRPP